VSTKTLSKPAVRDHHKSPSYGGERASAGSRGERDTRGGSRLCERFGIDDANLATRRTFIKLTERERELLEEFIPWAQAAAPKIAKEFYDWQFAFPPTRRFFENHARKKNVSLDTLRVALEKTQAGYIVQGFEGARDNWGAGYFERRLFVGWLHDQINLPFKWYIGSYVEMQSLVRRHLKAELKSAERAATVAEAVSKVFNYDMQAIGDSFLMSTLESFGLDLSAVEADPGADRTEHVDQLKSAVATIIEQADSLAADHLHDEVLQEHVASAGRLGESFARLNDALNLVSEQVSALARGDVAHESFAALEGDLSGKVLGQAVQGMLHVRTEITNAARAIARGDVSIDVKKRSEEDALGESMGVMIGAIRRLTADVETLIKAALAGNLSFRADVGHHQGEYRRIIEGINSTLDAVVHPISDASSVLSKVAAKDLTARVSGNYVGDFARLKTDINRMTEDLQNNMREFSQRAQTLASASEELTAVSQEMGSSASETSSQAGVVSAASEQVSTNVASVATSAEEMNASIKEIARNAAEAARIATTAVTVARQTNETVNKLGESSVEIGKVIKVITSIAQQTNLLALNATIEAARAGEAGKGFAVVANEVKELAKQTAAATEEISQKIEAIQHDTGGAVKAITEIGSIIDQINGIQNTTASAVEEQTATTNEIARNASEAAKGGSEIARNITSVSEAARHTAQGASDSLAAAKELSKLAADLSGMVDQFKFR